MNKFDLVRYMWFRKSHPKIRKISGIPPLTFKSNGKALKNYRIYGQTVDGESVGDRTGNLFDMKTFAETAYPQNATVNYSENSLIFTATQIDAYVNQVYSQLTIPVALRSSCINVQPLTTYTISMNAPYKCFISWINDSFDPVAGYIQIPNNQTSYTFTTPEDCTKLLLRLGKDVTNIGDTFTISNIMLNTGSTPLPYEPYGYRVPVTVNDITTNIYLPEPLKMVGDEAEYISYADQKLHRIGEDDIDVNLPELPTLAGTNTLSIGTEVQPSKVYIKGKFKRITTTYVQSIEPDNTNNKIIFVVRAYRSKNDRIVRAGLVATNDPAIGVNINVNSTVITSDCKVFVKKAASVTPTTDNIKYTWTKTKVTDGEIWYVRSYVEYINSDNEQLIIYSDAAKASLDGII